MVGMLNYDYQHPGALEAKPHADIAGRHDFFQPASHQHGNDVDMEERAPAAG